MPQVRKDTKMVVSELQAGSMRVIMATGDAALTALHVSMEVGITHLTDPTKALLLQTLDAKLVWQQMRTPYEGGALFQPHCIQRTLVCVRAKLKWKHQHSA